MSEETQRTVSFTGKDGQTSTFRVKSRRDSTSGDVIDLDALEEDQRQHLIGMLGTVRDRAEEALIPEHVLPPVTPIALPGTIVNHALVDALAEALRPVIAEEVERALIRVLRKEEE